MTDPAPMGRPTDVALWASMALALRRSVLPQIDDPHTRQLVTQLVGLATYARDRGPDPTAERVDELVAALDGLVQRGNPIVADRWSAAHGHDSRTVMTACAQVLAAALDADEAARLDVNEQLRPLMLGHLDADLASEQMLLGAYRGTLADE